MNEMRTLLGILEVVFYVAFALVVIGLIYAGMFFVATTM